MKVAMSVTQPGADAKRFGALGDDSDSFGQCMRTLAETAGASRSDVDRAVRKLARSMVAADAEDVAYHALLKVCERHARERLAEIKAYYWRSIKNRAATFCRTSGRVEPIGYDELPEYEACGRFYGSEAQLELTRILGKLSATSRWCCTCTTSKGARGPRSASASV